MPTVIHPTAIVSSGAEIGVDVHIGPFCTVGSRVKIGDRCELMPNVHIAGDTRIGCENTFHPGSSIGGPPQDKKYKAEPTRLIIGDRNTFRECVTVNLGTVQDQGVTRLGNDNWIMAYSHIAHDCVVGNQVTIANSTQLAGHVHVGDWVVLGGFTGVHQFCKIGAHAMAGVGSVVLHDIPPYVMCSGNTAQAHGINSEGLKRRGFSAQDIAALRNAYKVLYKSGLTLEQAKSELIDLSKSESSVVLLAEFLSGVTRGIVR